MRLSRDDENYGDSVSIETQRTILQQYAKEQGLHVVGEYVDDGWSGTNFERPDFQRMITKQEAGKYEGKYMSGSYLRPFTVEFSAGIKF